MLLVVKLLHILEHINLKNIPQILVTLSALFSCKGKMAEARRSLWSRLTNVYSFFAIIVFDILSSYLIKGLFF